MSRRTVEPEVVVETPPTEPQDLSVLDEGPVVVDPDDLVEEWEVQPGSLHDDRPMTSMHTPLEGGSGVTVPVVSPRDLEPSADEALARQLAIVVGVHLPGTTYPVLEDPSDDSDDHPSALALSQALGIDYGRALHAVQVARQMGYAVRTT